MSQFYTVQVVYECGLGNAYHKPSTHEVRSGGEVYRRGCEKHATEYAEERNSEEAEQ